MEAFKKGLDSFIEKSGLTVLTSVAILIIGLIIVRLFCGTLKKVLKRSKLDPICHKFVISFVKITLDIIVLIMAFSKLGVPMTSMVAILGAAGLAIGLALQDSLANIAGGFILLFSKPFKVGDYVEVSDVSGTVKHINILQTKLLTIDNKAIYIPNGQVSSTKIINYSAEKTRRLDLQFSIGYNDDVNAVKRLLLEIVENNKLSLLEPAPIIRVSSHGESSVKIATKVWVLTENYWDLNYDLLEDVKFAFTKNGISVPFNKLEVNIKQSEEEQA